MANVKRSAIRPDLRFDYPLSWFKNPSNIPNQESVSATIDWFETGPGKRAFTPIEFLNLLYKQLDFIGNNIYEIDEVTRHIHSLPITDLQRHILTGFILKRFGGYPASMPDRAQEKTLKAIEQIFLTGDPESPERQFCKADMQMRKNFMKLGIAFTTSINYGIDAKYILEEMDESSLAADKVYFSFKELFREAVVMGALGPFTSDAQYLVEQSKNEYNFNSWLSDTKGWLLGDEISYKDLLRRSVFIEFLKHEKEQQKYNANKHAAEKELWNLDTFNLHTEQKQADISENHIIIENQLIEFKDLFKSANEFDRAVISIAKYLDSGEITIANKIFVKSGSKKKFAYALGEIWKNTANGVIPLEYLKLCKNLFSIFSTDEIEDKTYKSSNLYKYFLTKT